MKELRKWLVEHLLEHGVADTDGYPLADLKAAHDLLHQSMAEQSE